MRALLCLLVAAVASGQTYVTVNGPIAAGTGTGWNGSVVYSHPAWTCGDTSVGPETITIRVRGGIFSQQFLADCPAPYEITYVGTSNGKAYWTIPGSKAPATTIRKIQSDYVPTPYWQISDAMLAVAPGGAGKCRGTLDGKAWAWLDCGGGGSGGSVSWGGIGGLLNLQLDLSTALNGKAPLSHSHTIGEIATLGSELAGKEPAFVAGSSGWLRFDKTWTVPTKADLGLGSVDNTSDNAKPVSALQAAAIAAKEDPLIVMAPLNRDANSISLPVYGNVDGGARPVTADSPGITGNCAEWTEDGGIGDSGAPCGVGSGSGSTTGLYAGVIDFPAIVDGTCTDSVITAPGLTAGRSLAIATPAAWPAGLVAIAIAGTGWVNIRTCNFGGVAANPVAGTFAVRDLDAVGYLTASATINFGAIPDGSCAAATLTLPGATSGDNVAAGWPSGLEVGLTGQMFVSAADTITVRLCNWSGAPALDPAAATFRAAITR